jgi:hypothetical protein
VNLQDPANHVPIDLNTESQRDQLANAGTAPLGFRRFLSTTAGMSALAGPLGQIDGRAERRTTCDIFVFSATCGNAARWKVSER